MAALSSILAWRSQWTEEPGGSMGSQRVEETEHSGTQLLTRRIGGWEKEKV